MEKLLKIKVDKKFSVYGRVSGPLSKPLFIIVHGLPGHDSESFYDGAVKYFASRGYATFRFNLYSWQKDARQLIDCTLRTHADDLDVIVRYFRKRGVKNVFVAGHSYGCPTILLSRKKDFDGVALWDPSFKLSFTKVRYGFSGGTFVKQLDGYFMRWGAGVILGRAMAEEADSLAWEDLTKGFSLPLKIFAAGKGILVPGAKQYFKEAIGPKTLEIVKGATHYFDDKPGMQERVYAGSKQWFDRFR